MIDIMKNANVHWVKYSNYTIRKADNEKEYIVPDSDAHAIIGTPVDDPMELVLDMLNVSRKVLGEADDGKDAIMGFIGKYGLLGFMTGLPVNVRFTEYDKVCFPYNEFLKTEVMDIMEYIHLFFPFHKPDIKHTADGITYEEVEDREQQALMLTFEDYPLAKHLVMRKDYAERYDWVVNQFKTWAFIFYTSFFFYEDYEVMSDDTRNFYRHSMAAFDTNAPTYHVELHEKPVIVWDFNSLITIINMALACIVADDKNKLRICKRCGTVFVSDKEDEEYCSANCSNR